MCGLYGSIGFAPDRRRINMVAHRGPDGEGFQVFDSPAGTVCLAHRRLAIIDVSDAGSQPMADASRRFHLVFNGEIYNYLELRDELAAEGRAFTTETDSEVLLTALAAWGEGALDKLRGMFAFLFWDDRDKRLFAARDRFGIKPLYLAATSHGVAFSSEIKQLLGLPGLGSRMNLARVHDFLDSGISDHTQETLFADVLQVRAGECLWVETSPRIKTRRRRWYAAEAGAPLNIGETEAADRFGGLLTDAVRLHLRSDVPVGSCLSGGVDSSSIVCLMAKMIRSRGAEAPVTTVSACYAEKSADERSFIDMVVARAGSRPCYVFPRAEDVLDLAARITWHQDEPFGSTSIFAQWCVFEEARKAGVKVMLDGQGADEQLAGYHWLFPYYMADLARRARLSMLLRTLLERRHWHGAPVTQQVMYALARLLPEGAAKVLRRLRRRRDWLASNLISRHGGALSAEATAREALGLPSSARDLAGLCVFLTHAYNLQMLLHWEDRNSMAHSVEARVPFLDHPLVEFSLALGGQHKMIGGETKRVLRRAMSGILPDAIRDRRDKLGFSTPEQEWFRGPLRGAMIEGVEATLARYPELFNAAETRAFAAGMLDGKAPVDFALWRIVSFGVWGETFRVTL